MILKGNQRAGGRQMALHLLKSENEHVTVHEVSGFIASDVLGALNEAYALSKGTKCKQFIYSLSLNPPQDQSVPIDVFENTLERIEKKLDLEGQPRVVVFHEKQGRRHAHCVWSRIDTENMKAINISHPKLTLQTIAKSLYLEHGWSLPEGFRDKSKKDPLNYTRAEWQQALRINRRPDDIKREFQEAWAVSDSKQGFKAALQEQGYYLAQGRRGFVAVDVHGQVYSLTRQLSQKKKALEARLGKSDALPPVSEIKSSLKGKLNKLFNKFSDELNLKHEIETEPLDKAKAEMTERHRRDRKRQDEIQKKRWFAEELKRSARVRHGFKGLWDKLTGSYQKSRNRNEREAWLAYQRDQKQQEELIKKQLAERQNLQTQINLLRENQENERKALTRELSHADSIEQTKAQTYEKSRQSAPKKTKTPQHEIQFDDFDLDTDGLEPEI